MNAASLSVKIGADVRDFEVGMSKVERAAKRGLDSIGDAGRKMTAAFTLPFALAMGVAVKQATEAEDTAGRFARVFGDAAEKATHDLKELTATIPQSVDNLQALAVASDNMLQGLGYGADAAANMSVQMVKLAGDMAAFAHVPIGDAIEALDKGLAGKTKGMLQFGVAIKEQEIHQEALRRGLLENHRTLTQLGTAEVVMSLITQRMGRVTGEAARTAGEAKSQFGFLKSTVEEMAEAYGNVALPAVVSVAGALRNAAQAAQDADPGLQKILVWSGAIVALGGPALLMFKGVAKGFIALRTASLAFGAAEGVAGFLAAVAAAPVAAIVGGLVAVTAAVAGLYYVWQKFSGIDDKSPLLKDPALAKLLKPVAAKSAPGALSEDERKAFDKFKDTASLLSGAFDAAVQHGEALDGIFSSVNSEHAQALAYMKAQHGALTDEGAAAGAIADQMQRIHDIIALTNASPAAGAALLKQIGERPFDAGAAGATSAVDAANAYRADLMKRSAASQYAPPHDSGAEMLIKSRDMVNAAATDLTDRSALLKLPDGFNAAAQAAVELGEEQRRAAEDTALAFEKIRLRMGAFGEHLTGLSTAMQSVAVQMFDAATQFAQGLAQQLAGRGKGSGIGGMIGSILGGALPAAGTLLAGPLGAALGGIAGALVGGLFDHAVTDSANSLNTMASAANQVTAALLNLPNGFRVAQARYDATQTSGSGAQWYGGDQRGAPDDHRPIQFVVDGKVLASMTLAELRRRASVQYGNSSRWSEVMA